MQGRKAGMTGFPLRDCKGVVACIHTAQTLSTEGQTMVNYKLGAGLQYAVGPAKPSESR
jgi:hypothetical protein